MYGQDWNQYIYDLRQHIDQQNQRIKALEDQIQSLLSNNKGNVIIEKIEYKFDQLKVETLSGSLHIGLSPEDLEKIDEIGLGQMNQQGKVAPFDPFEEQLLTELNQWLQQSSPNLIRELASTYHFQVDPSHQNLLLQDIQKQFPDRIRYYKNQQIKKDPSINEMELQDYIKNQIKGEVQHSLTNYMKNYKGEMKNDDGSS